jgi:aspartyl protease family protein
MLGAFAVVGLAAAVAPRPGGDEQQGQLAVSQASGRPNVFASDSDPGGNGHGSIALERAPNGHFFTNVVINGIPVRFVVDTGAYKVLLTPQDARRIGLAQGQYSERGIGVGGEVRLMPVTLKRVELGPISLGAVEAVVSEQPQDISLLGQNFLARLASVEIRGDTMTLTN